MKRSTIWRELAGYRFSDNGISDMIGGATMTNCWESGNVDTPGRDLKIQVQHGVDCIKVEHMGTGYLHHNEEDSSYIVDSVLYCGRCHVAI